MLPSTPCYWLHRTSPRRNAPAQLAPKTLFNYYFDVDADLPYRGAHGGTTSSGTRSTAT